MKFFKYLFVVVFILAAFASWQTYEYFSRPLPPTTPRIVTVRSGDSLRMTAAELQSKEVISSVDMFVFWARAMGHHTKIKTGEYEIPANLTMAQLFTILRSGKSIGYRVTIPEGTNLFEVAKFLEEQNLCSAVDFIQLVSNKKFVKSQIGIEASSLEGYLFPDTYFFTKADGVKLIVQQMVQRFKDKFKNLGLPLPKGWTLQEVVTLASIIEKETGAEFERKIISSVFHNRMQKNMRLQTDPTVMYGVQVKTGAPVVNITKKDLLTDTIYNTYTRNGLPPGPISNPGIEAIEAAIQPESTSYLFFVSRNDGTHVFTETYKDHSKAVTAFQLNSKAREGKSWRDLKKKPTIEPATGKTL
ncbi:MAG: endolytic transglycosylase MltG [Bdellovibrionales bacterium]|nr:endolytic transglycosylase MltG [Bdellovibrionales bacterium]